ncbi:efflux RND transporter permease subunit [Leucothrix arctica]|uniref:Multidrug transporter AcrB n=1 Tax=Leucothrix arctica TaxID=1481894 RepID=A0A317CM34_9GAMM|nr:efflux RND transporter permease subunit [Leucothrix arctica]PWQ99586.1 multidrug transporter AcrB [Leucothrix arctica]
MDLAKFAITKRVISGLATFLILVGGYTAYNLLPRFEDPEFIIRQAQVVTPYQGASSIEVAEEVTDPLENALQQLQGVKEIKSISTPGKSEITIEFEIAASKTRDQLNQRFTQLRAKISDTQSRLPPNVSPSMVFDDFGDVYALYYAITGDGYTLNEVHEYAKTLQKELVLVPGVSKAVLQGMPTQAIYVEYTPSRVAQLGISSGQIAQVLGGQNLVTSAGEVELGTTRIRIKPNSVIDSVANIEALRITDSQSGVSYRLGDIATVVQKDIDPPAKSIFSNGKPAITLGISNVLGGNVVDMGTAIRARIAELEQRRPQGIELKAISDQGATVKVSVDDFVMNVVIALVIVVGTLLVFMGLRSGILMGGILLVTVAGTLIGMYVGGLQMQRISLGALIIALGMLVDNAIVVVEGTLVRVQKGEDAASASIAIVNQTKWPLLGGTVVGILAFSPIGFSPDNTGEYAGSLFWTILISLMFSWLVAVWLTPYFCTLTFGKSVAKNNVQVDAKEGVILGAYRRFLVAAIKVRWVAVALVVLLFASAVYSFAAVPKGFFPASTRPQFVVDYYLPPGTDVRKTAKDLQQVSEWLREQEGVTGTTTAVGGGHLRFMLPYIGESSEASYGQILIDVENLAVIDSLLTPVRNHLSETLPESNYKVWKFVLGPASGSKIQARFSGPEPAVLRELAKQAKEVFHEEGAIAIRDDWREQIKTIQPVINEVAARQVGLSAEDISKALQGHFSGTQIGVLREGEELRKILFRPAEAFRTSPEALSSVRVFSNSLGESIPINQVVDRFDVVFDDYKVRRVDRKLAIIAQADPADGVNSYTLYERIQPKLEAMVLPTGYHLEWLGEAGDSARAQKGLGSIMPLGFGAMILVVILLFNAYRQPLVIWLTVPLSIVGVSYGLATFQSPLDFMGILAALSLTGMMVKNAIVLVDETDSQIAAGKARMNAVLDSAVSRVRPVVLGMVTTVLGVAPLLPDPFFRSLSIVIMCGLSFATVLTLVIVPVLYTIFFGVKSSECEA